MEEALAKASAIKSRKKVLNYDDYVALTPPDSGQYELHNGKIIEMPSPTPAYQDVAIRLSSHMFLHASTKKLGKVYAAPLDTLFDPINTFQPDILFISKERASIIGDKKIHGAPDLVVEILSEGNSAKEMSYKKYIYESCLVKEYWLINLQKQTVTVYANVEGELMPLGIYKNKDTVKSQVLNGFEIGVDDILGS